MAHKSDYANQSENMKFTETSNTKGRSTVSTNMRKSNYRSPSRGKKMKKQKLTTVMSGGY
jgi:hypothetical protein